MDWFLPSGIKPSEKWLFDTVDANDIKVYVSYNEYFKRLAQLFEAAKEGDEIFIVGWETKLETQLFQGLTALQFLEKANAKKVKIRLLASGPLDTVYLKSIFAINGLKGPGEKKAMVDEQLLPGSDHHQKAVFISVSSIPYLFVGGMDITYDRRNWIDVQAEIEGQGALLGFATLEERWKSVNSLYINPLNSTLNYNIPVKKKDSEFKVQFVRTYSPTKTMINSAERTIFREYAANGEFTYFNLVKKSILHCRKHIYQEDHFFQPMGGSTIQPIEQPITSLNIERSSISSSSLDPVLQNKARQKDFKYVAIGRDYYPGFAAPYGKNKFNSNQMNTFPALLCLGNPFDNKVTYLHSKLWIFDDEFVIIGSANYWNPSFNLEPTPGRNKNEGDTTKSEFGVAFTSNKETGEIFGFPKVSYIHALRLKLWERIRQFAEPAFSFKPDQIGDYEKEFEIFISDFDDNGIKRKLFIPMK